MDTAFRLVRWALYGLVALVVVCIVPGLPPREPLEEVTLTPAPPFQGPLSAGNLDLNRLERLFEERVHGPEGLAVSDRHPGVIFSTVLGGQVVKLSQDGSSVTPVVQFGESCSALWDVDKCGRPAGIRFDSRGQLIVADAVYGIFKVDPQTRTSETLVYKDSVVNGKTSHFFNGVEPAEDGRVYYTSSSTNYRLNEALGEVLGPPSGRLLVYDPVTNVSRSLVEKIHFANGLILSPDQDFIVVSEGLQYRLLKHWIRGPHLGMTELFADGLPGFPDNLSRSPDGNILVSLVTVRLPDRVDPVEFLLRHPWIRKLLLRLLHLIKWPLDVADSYLQLPVIRRIASQIMGLDSFQPVPYAIVLEMDWNGRIVRSWHSNMEAGFSEAQITDGYMYLASPTKPYLGRLKL